MEGRIWGSDTHSDSEFALYRSRNQYEICRRHLGVIFGRAGIYGILGVGEERQEEEERDLTFHSGLRPTTFGLRVAAKYREEWVIGKVEDEDGREIRYCGGIATRYGWEVANG